MSTQPDVLRIVLGIFRRHRRVMQWSHPRDWEFEIAGQEFIFVYSEPVSEESDQLH